MWLLLLFYSLELYSLQSVGPSASRMSTRSKSFAAQPLPCHGNHPKLLQAQSSREQDAEAVAATVPGRPISQRPFLTQWLMPFMPRITVERSWQEGRDD